MEKADSIFINARNMPEWKCDKSIWSPGNAVVESKVSTLGDLQAGFFRLEAIAVTIFFSSSSIL